MSLLPGPGEKHEEERRGEFYFIQSVFKVVLRKSISTQICRLILDISIDTICEIKLVVHPSPAQVGSGGAGKGKWAAVPHV